MAPSAEDHRRPRRDAVRGRGPRPRRRRRGRARGRGRRAGAVDAALALVAKRLGPDDTARAKPFLDADLAACARLLLDKLYERHLGRRGDAGARRPGR